MKNVSKLFGLIALVAIIGLSMAACSSDGNGSGGGDLFQGTWTAGDDDTEMTIVAKNGSFTVSMDGTEAFKGTYTVSGKTVDITFTHMKTETGWEAYPEDGEEGLPPKNTTGTISGGQFTIAGGEDGESMTFTKQGGGSKPGSGGSGSGGGNTPGGGGNESPKPSIFLLTGIPNDFNKKYAMFYAEDNSGSPFIIGADTVNVSNETMSGTLVEIQNGKVSLPMWVWHDNAFTRYHGDDTVNGVIMIFSQKNVSEGTEPIEERFFSVTFSDGAATKTWNQGQDENPNSGGGGGGDKPEPDDGGEAGGGDKPEPPEDGGKS